MAANLNYEVSGYPDNQSARGSRIIYVKEINNEDKREMRSLFRRCLCHCICNQNVPEDSVDQLEASPRDTSDSMNSSDSKARRKTRSFLKRLFSKKSSSGKNRVSNANANRSYLVWTNGMKFEPIVLPCYQGEDLSSATSDSHEPNFVTEVQVHHEEYHEAPSNELNSMKSFSESDWIHQDVNEARAWSQTSLPKHLFVSLNKNTSSSNLESDKEDLEEYSKFVESFGPDDGYMSCYTSTLKCQGHSQARTPVAEENWKMDESLRRYAKNVASHLKLLDMFNDDAEDQVETTKKRRA